MLRVLSLFASHLLRAQRRSAPAGRIRLTVLVVTVGITVGLFLVWDKEQRLNTFPTLETGRYVGLISDPRPSASLLALPIVADVPNKGEPVLLLLDETNEGSGISRRLPQGDGTTGPVIIDIKGGEQIQLVGTREGTVYRGRGRRASGGELRWTLRPIQKKPDATPENLSTFLEQRAKMALLSRRVDAAKVGVTKATDESMQFKKAITSQDVRQTRAEDKTLRTKEADNTVIDEKALVESKRADLVQKIALLETVAPGSRVARSAFRTLQEQQRWINGILSRAPAPEVNQEDMEAIQRGIEVDKLQRAIVVAQRRIDAVLRASDDILGE